MQRFEFEELKFSNKNRRNPGYRGHFIDEEEDPLGLGFNRLHFSDFSEMDIQSCETQMVQFPKYNSLINDEDSQHPRVHINFQEPQTEQINYLFNFDQIPLFQSIQSQIEHYKPDTPKFELVSEDSQEKISIPQRNSRLDFLATTFFAEKSALQQMLKQVGQNLSGNFLELPQQINIFKLPK